VTIERLIEGFAHIVTAWSVLSALVGVVAGIVVGALPGLTATMAVAILSPFTFFMEAAVGIPFLLGVYKGAIYGGSIPAVLINTPGTAAAAATCLDGNALARKGEARRGLEISLFASVIADLLATFVLIFVTAPLAAVALRFGPPEITMLFALSMTMVAAVSGDSLLKGLISAAFGILLACIGLDPMSGYERFTFGSADLTGGVSLVPLLIGMFALSEILIQAESRLPRLVERDTWSPFGVTLADLRRVAATIVWSTGIGVFIGVLPGIGAEISCWIAYGAAKQRSKRPEEFGKGSIEGVAAAEAGNNAVCPAALIPMLVFGIPGDTVTAILLGAFMAKGLSPGPLLFAKHGQIIYGLFAMLLITNVMMLALGYLAIRHVARLILIPQGLLMPAVLTICFAGSFAVNSSSFDVLITIAGGLAGYLMRKAAVPIPPLVIALLLAPGFENGVRQSLVLSGGDPTIFLTRPISAAIAVVLIAAAVFFVRMGMRLSGAAVPGSDQLQTERSRP
jgi:putative tricarboxylic transport membrane protein